MDKDKILKWLLDWKSDIAKELSELPDDYKYTYQYLDGINDTLRIMINAIQEDNFSGKDK